MPAPSNRCGLVDGNHFGKPQVCGEIPELRHDERKPGLAIRAFSFRTKRKRFAGNARFREFQLCGGNRLLSGGCGSALCRAWMICPVECCPLRKPPVRPSRQAKADSGARVSSLFGAPAFAFRSPEILRPSGPRVNDKGESRLSALAPATAPVRTAARASMLRPGPARYAPAGSELLQDQGPHASL